MKKYEKKENSLIINLIDLKNYWKEEQKKYITKNVKVGDYTYGYPRIV